MVMQPSFGRRRISSGIVGPLTGQTPGRADKLPLNVPKGAHVIPADVVGALGGGNSAHGHRVLFGMFPGSKMAKRGRARSRIASMKPPKMANGGSSDTLPIMASDGEFLVSPEDVAQIGGGDIGEGHRLLNAFIMNTRQENIKKLQSIPEPSK